jgi:hypothetical protein
MSAAEELYRTLPELYRTRDDGDLAKYLTACGKLLDAIRNTLDQRLADSFPDNPPAGRACQPWLIPYFAQLVDVRLVSPDENGRRDEVSNAVAWRQRKGTLAVIERIAEAVGRVEVEIQEGWKRTAIAPRVDTPRIPAAALGEDARFDRYRSHPLWAARHPDLPAAMADLRHPSRAVQVDAANPAARNTKFGDQRVWWRQANPHGVPCFPGTYEDASRRTVDVRTPAWNQGHIHPKRVVLWTPPPAGFFEPGRFPHQGDTALQNDGEHVVEDVIVDGTLTLAAGTLHLRRCAVRSLTVSGQADELAVRAEDCLFERISVPGHTVRAEACTVLGDIACARLQASDCLFAGSVTLPAALDDRNCIRYSRVPEGLALLNLSARRNTARTPAFCELRFGEPGCAVLHPATGAAIRFGAEDGGEMGAHHSWRYSLLMAAVLDKLKEFLPIGMEAVMVPDLRLHRTPWPPCAPDSGSADQV